MLRDRGFWPMGQGGPTGGEGAGIRTRLSPPFPGCTKLHGNKSLRFVSCAFFLGRYFSDRPFWDRLFFAGETRYSCNITRLTVIMIRGSGQAAFIPQLIPLYWHVTHTVWEQPFEVMCAIGSFGKVVGPS